MATSIYEKQNEDFILKCLVVQREEYSFIKKIKFIKFLIFVGFVTIFTILVSMYDNDKLFSISTLLNVGVLISAKYLDNWTSKLQCKAADIQQYIDSLLFNFVVDKTFVSEKNIFTNFEIAEIISSVKEKDIASVKNWYSDYSSYSAYMQVFSCQKENIRWDEKLRIFYKWILLFVLMIFLSGIVFYGILFNISFNKWLVLISFSLVIIDYIISSVCNLNTDLKRLEELSKMQSEIERQRNDKEFETLSEFQTKIYEHRKKCFLIPDFVYKMKLNKYQNTEDNIAKILFHFES